MPNNIHTLEDLPEEILPKDRYVLWLSAKKKWMAV
jgi:hypothetical protein